MTLNLKLVDVHIKAREQCMKNLNNRFWKQLPGSFLLKLCNELLSFPEESGFKIVREKCVKIIYFPTIFHNYKKVQRLKNMYLVQFEI